MGILRGDIIRGVAGESLKPGKESGPQLLEIRDRLTAVDAATVDVTYQRGDIVHTVTLDRILWKPLYSRAVPTGIEPKTE